MVAHELAALGSRLSALGLVVALTTISSHAQVQSVAYLKAASPDEDDQLGAGDLPTGVSVALSGDGVTLAAGARLEDSAATGVNGNQSDNSADSAGAAYIFALGR